MENEHIVYVIKKVRIFVIPMEYKEGVSRDDVGRPVVINHYATIYDGGTHLETVYGDSYDNTHDRAVKWVHDNFDIPESVTLRTELPMRMPVPYFDEHGRLRQRYEEEE